jgi:hypothetical protein
LRSEHSEHAAVVESEIAKTQKFLEDSAVQNERQLKQSEKEHYRQQVLAWVSAVDPSLNFLAARKTLSPGIIYGSWLLGDERFIEWKKGQSHCLWLKGSCKPQGSLKTAEPDSSSRIWKDSSHVNCHRPLESRILQKPER